ncbi:MAG: sulfatase-like hydrolase/transferase, partial [Verrucomicrobiales bacterium]|nr:sulfatase-like hydrolase/transferase [Verrucomicrobiales bacterium]
MKSLFLIPLFFLAVGFAAEKPHIVFVMADDQGWGQTGYAGHPDLITPNLDKMAANGLRFNCFYAGASNCSPSRATVLTGRSNDRTGVQNHGFPLRLQEKTIAQALREAGYTTGHFGKWHLNGLRGPGVPVLADDTHSPGAFGFDHWLTVTNYFDRDPILGRLGVFEEFKGDSSEVAVEQALAFIKKEAGSAPTFSVIWYGTPHDPMVASEADRKPFSHLPEEHQHQYGEILALDRSIGNLRKSLRDMGIAENT